MYALSPGPQQYVRADLGTKLQLGAADVATRQETKTARDEEKRLSRQAEDKSGSLSEVPLPSLSPSAVPTFSSTK